MAIIDVAGVAEGDQEVDAARVKGGECPREQVGIVMNVCDQVYSHLIPGCALFNPLLTPQGTSMGRGIPMDLASFTIFSATFSFFSIRARQ